MNIVTDHQLISIHQNQRRHPKDCVVDKLEESQASSTVAVQCALVIIRQPKFSHYFRQQ